MVKTNPIKANQSRSEFTPKGAEIPTGGLLGILKPGTNPPAPNLAAVLIKNYLTYRVHFTFAQLRRRAF